MALRAFYFIITLTMTLTCYWIRCSQCHLLVIIKNNWFGALIIFIVCGNKPLLIFKKLSYEKSYYEPFILHIWFVTRKILLLDGVKAWKGNQIHFHTMLDLKEIWRSYNSWQFQIKKNFDIWYESMLNMCNFKFCFSFHHFFWLHWPELHLMV